MRMQWSALALIACVAAELPVDARAEIGWSLDQYTQTYGAGERGFGQAHEFGFQLGQCRLVVELDSTDHSVSELWLLGTVRDTVPERVLKDGETAAKGRGVKKVTFKAHDALTANIHEATVDGTVVRADVRNGLLNRVAYCGKVPDCSFWDQLQNRCASTVPCDILDRVLSVDNKIDEFQVQAEAALERIH